MKAPFRSARPRRWGTVLAVTLLTIGLVAPTAVAEFPYPTPPAGQDPYAYHQYMRITAAQFPPNDPEMQNVEFDPQPDTGDRWKYTSKNACEDSDYMPNCNPAVVANPQELRGVMGASVDRAWERTTGRPDVVIAVHDSGINWTHDGKFMDLATKTWLNRGELPLPDWGSPHPNDPYDRNGDGVFNLRDYCPDWEEENDCGGSGDSRVRGNAATNDTDFNGSGYIDPEELIFLFSDGVDDDGNGYVDDFVGWDSYEDDNDPYDEVHYGHGTGEAWDSTAEANNGRGTAGTCPNCMVMHMRVGDSFIADVNDFAQGVLYATDNGASVIQSALGTLNNSRFAQEAINYAYRRGVVLIASAADESAGHHNQPSALEHAVTMNSVGEPAVPAAPPPSYLEFRGCTNWGSYITAAVPSNSCSSEAVGRSAGMAGLAYAAAKNEIAEGELADYGSLDGAGGVPAGRGLSAEEIDQLISTSADDMNFTEPPYQAQPKYTPQTKRYPATPGWDAFFGYGRINSRRIVEAIVQHKIPPEADITSPKWFDIVDPDDGDVEIEGRVASLRTPQYDYKVEWAVWSWRDTNLAPAWSSSGVTYPASPNDLTAPRDGLLATIDDAEITAALETANLQYGPTGHTDGPAVDPVTGRGENETRHIPDKFGIVTRVIATAEDASGNALQGPRGVQLPDCTPDQTACGNPNEDVSAPLTGIGTKNFFFHDDPALFPGFPKDLQGDGAAAPRFADLDDDGVDELIVATSNGLIHAYEHGGGEVPGWPVHVSDADLNYDAPAYQSGEITTPVYAAILRSPAVGDLDRDGDLEVVSGDFQGRVWAFDNKGNVVDGFPVRSNPAYSQPQRPDREAGYYDDHPELTQPPSSRYPGPDGNPATPDPLPNDPDLVPDLVNRHGQRPNDDGATKVNRLIWWMEAPPTLANIDPTDDDLEILAGGADRHLYAFRSDGSPVNGWPVMLRDPAKVDGYDPNTHEIVHNDDGENEPGAKIINAPAVGDIDGNDNGELEIVAVVNEQYVEEPNTDDPAVIALASASGGGNNRIYALAPTGAATPAGTDDPKHPHEQAYLAGWPARIATVVIDLLPVVGSGPDGSPVIGNVNGGSDLEVGIYGTAGPGYILNKDGNSIYGETGGRDRTLLVEPRGPNSNSPDSPSIPAVSGGIFTDLPEALGLAFVAPTAGAGKLTDVLLPEDQVLSDNQLSMWELQSGGREQHAAWPREVNDLQFLATPASADLDGDDLEEILEGSAYSDLHAFNYLGEEPGLHELAPDGWPKFTGGWTVAPPAVGDFNGDGNRDVAHAIREGRLFVWNGNGASVCAPASWPEFGHDGWMSNNIHTDAVRPRVVTDLGVSIVDGMARFSWTPPGDDGTCGSKVHSYEFRSSNEPITTDNFDQAAPVDGEPVPGDPGTTQIFALPQPACDRYYAFKSFDSNPATDTPAQPANISAASNSVLVPGSDPDVCNPKETSLAFTSPLRGQITDTHRIAARLMTQDGPVPDRTLKFTFQGREYTAKTNDNGVAGIDVRIRVPAGPTPVNVTFTAVPRFQAATLTRTFTVLRDDSRLRLRVARDTDGRGFTAKANLWEADRMRLLRHRRVSFYLNGKLLGRRLTGRSGTATFHADHRRLRRGDVIKAVFRGTKRFLPVQVKFTWRGRNGSAVNDTR